MLQKQERKEEGICLMTYHGLFRFVWWRITANHGPSDDNFRHNFVSR